MDNDTVPVHFVDPVLLADLPEGAKLIAIGLKILVVAPDLPVSWVTPTGLVALDMVPAPTHHEYK